MPRAQRRQDSGRSLFRALMREGISMQYLSGLLNKAPDDLIHCYVIGFARRQTEKMGDLLGAVVRGQAPARAFLPREVVAKLSK